MMSGLGILLSAVPMPEPWFSWEKLFDLAPKIIAELIVIAAAGLILWTEEQIKRHWQRAAIKVRRWVSGRELILLWIDADLTTVHRVANQLKTNFPFVRIEVLNAPSEILFYPMKPSVVPAVVLISTDVTKLSSDDKVREEVEEKLARYVLDGGGIVAGHDLIYRRTRSKYLCEVLGVMRDPGGFTSTNLPVKYEKTDTGRTHPIGRRLPDKFSLEDGEVLSVEWLPQVDVLFQEEEPDKSKPVRGLVAARQYEEGKIVWLNSCDHGKELAKSIGKPSAEFIDLLAASVEWAANLKQFAKGAPLIGAHRGTRTPAGKENTMAAFRSAIALEADFIETDVRRTADQVLVLHHDENIGALKIADTSFAVLQAEAAKEECPLATLDEILKLAKEKKIRLDIELKEAGYEQEVAAIIHANQMDLDSFVATSFLEEALIQFRESYPDATLGLLVGDRNWWVDFFPERRIRRSGAQFVAVKDNLVKLGFARRLSSKKIPVWVWTVNNPVRIAELLRMTGIEAVITDTASIGKMEQKRVRGG